MSGHVGKLWEYRNFRLVLPPHTSAQTVSVLPSSRSSAGPIQSAKLKQKRRKMIWLLRYGELRLVYHAALTKRASTFYDYCVN